MTPFLLALSALLGGLLLLAAVRLARSRALIARISRELEDARQGLERRVEERTAEQRHMLALLRAIIDDSSDAIFAKDADGRYLLCNASAGRVLGRPEEEVLGHTNLELGGRDDAAMLRAEQRDAEVLAANRLVSYDQEVELPEGTATYMISKGPLHDEAGRVVGTFGIARDISERKRVEAELKKQNERLAMNRQVLDTISEPVLVKGPRSRIVWANRAFREFVGMTAADLHGLRETPYTPADHTLKYVRDDAQVFATGQPLDIPQEDVMRFDGVVRPWHTVKSPLFGVDGNVIATVGVSRDIGAQRDAEAELRASEAFKLAILDSMKAEIAVLDHEGTIVAVNAPWRRFAAENAIEPGRPSPHAEVGGNYLSACGTGAEPVQARDGIRAVCDGRLATFELEYPCHSPQQLRWFSMSVTPLGTAAGGVVVSHTDISELKRAETALRASQAFLEKTGRLGGVGGWAMDLTSGEIHWTDQTCRIHDVAPGHRPDLDEALGYFSADGRAAIERAFSRTMTTGEGYDLELPMTTATGRAVWVQAIGEAEVVDGRVVRLHGAMQDVTARRVKDDALRQANEHLEAALRDASVLLDTLHTHAIVSVADRAGRIVEVNDAFCEISGYGRAELIGQDHRIINSGVQSRGFWTGMWRAIAGATPWRGEVCNRAKDGTLYWVDTLIAPYVGADGRVEKFVSIRTDITPRKLAEAAAARSAGLLRASIDAIDEAFVLFDAADRLEFCNDKYRELFGPAAHLVVRGVTFGELITGAHALGVYAPPGVDGDAWVAEHIATHRTGNITRVQHLADGRVLRATERHLADGHTVGFRIDITELVRAGEAAQAASLAKSQFLATMSHEIRTPMNSILGMLALLRRTPLSTRQADYAGKTESAARGLLGLLNEVLDFSKAEAGKLVLDPQPFSVERLLRDLSVILTAGVGGKRLEVMFDIDPALPRQLVGDSMRLQQVLVNLSGNAIKFTPSGEVVVSMTVRARNAAGVTVEIAVRDTGIGIAAENQARIFSAFTQAEASTTRRFGGSGLGLAISQRLVALMGGELALESEPGRGSRFSFTVTLPVGQAARDPSCATPAGAAPLRIMVIDDNPTAREVLARMGSALGWSVDVVDSGERALASLQTQAQQGLPCDAVFVDWQMPGLDGWETSRRIRKLAAPGQAPVIVMVTASDGEALAERTDAERALIDAFLVKPVTAAMLLDAVANARAGLAQPDAQRPRSGGATGAGRRLPGLRVLVVEDNPNNQQVARELLEDEGAHVRIARHGQEAIDMIGAARPQFDIVLMDLQMPVMDGLTATRRIRALPGMTPLPIVAMTANAMASDRADCLAAGMNDHVGKPFDLDELVELLCRLTGRVPTPAAPAAASLPAALHAAAAAAQTDLGAALDRLGGKREIYLRLLRGFVGELAGAPTQLRAHLDRGDTASAARALHTLRGVAATLGATALASEAARAEKRLLRAPLPAAAGRATDAACAAIDAATAPLANLLKALQAESTAGDDAPRAGAPGLDAGALQKALRGLAELLRHADMAAIDAMEALLQRFGVASGAPLASLDEAIAALDFERALQLCTRLVDEIEQA